MVVLKHCCWQSIYAESSWKTDSVVTISNMNKRGGKRKGAGRKMIGGKSRVIRARVAEVTEQALMLAGNGNLSEGIRRLADKHWRLIHGSLKVDQDAGSRPKQSDQRHHSDGSRVLQGQGQQSVSGGVEKEQESNTDEELRGDSTGQARDICLQSPRVLGAS